jgi:hypothetical protein
MTPEEWPICTPHERGKSPARRAGRERLSTVRRDFFLDPRYRLTEQERALMTAMLQRLVADIASEIQIALPEDWLPANDDVEGLIDLVSRAGLLDIEELFALFLRRADEERVATAANATSRQPAPSLIQPFVSDRDAEIAAAAMAVLIGRGRRLDRYGRTIVELDDVPPDSARALVFAVAAGLRERIAPHISGSIADRRLCDAATGLVQRQDPSKGIDLLMGRLASLLQAAGRLDDRLIGKAIDLADINFLSHALAAQSGLHHRDSFDELMSGDSRRVMMVLRLADCPRGTAAQLLAALGDLIGLSGDAHHLGAFESWSVDQLDDARGWLHLDPSFQTALSSVGHGNGHRAH